MRPSIVALTGAGISAESGIPPFRSSGGLWEAHRIEDVATPQAFARNSTLVYEFYNARRAKLLDASVRPNKAHAALAALETWADLCIVTQNIDNLHERAGSTQVIHIHGELLSALCTACGHTEYTEENFDSTTTCAHCHRNATLRPNVVWFGELPYHLDEITKKISSCKYFVCIGSSGLVHPAAGFAEEARRSGAQTVLLNKESIAGNSHYDLSIYGPATKIVPDWIQQLQQNEKKYIS